ncbi:MAG TPA: MFS transporter [Solimonas sp.]
MRLPSLGRTRVVPLIIACAVFMENLDSTIIATALPQIARAMNEDPLHLSLAITAYLLSLAVFIPLSGWVADRYGARRVFRAAILVFTLGSALCGISQSMPQLVGARILQGIGGAMMVPVGRLVLLRAIPKSELIAAMTWLTVPALFGPILGPPVGGLIVTYASWRWIFFINLPIGLLGWWLVTRFIDDTRAEVRAPLDLGGWLIIGSGLVLLVSAFELLGKNLIANAVVWTMIGAGLGLIAIYVWRSRTHAMPIVDLNLLRITSFRISTTGGSLYRVATGAYTLLMPLMLQLGFGYSAAASGGITFASAAGAMLMKTTAPRIVKRFGFRSLLLANALLSAVFLFGCALFTAATPQLVMLSWLLAYGFFRSLQFTCINTLAYADMPQTRMSQATSFASTTQQLSLSLGVGIGSQLLNTFRTLRDGGALEARDFQTSLVVVAALTAVSALLFRRLASDAGNSVSGHRGTEARP